MTSGTGTAKISRCAPQMDIMALENPQRELKQQGRLRDLNADSMGGTPFLLCAFLLWADLRDLSLSLCLLQNRGLGGLSATCYFW